jgi:hypothetical protein
MHYLEFLDHLHLALAPRTYLEIGIRNGDSLALSRCPSIGVDPGFEITRELRGPTSLVRSTSDQFFDSLGPDGPFGALPVDLAFIDGMHLLEFAVRDFANIERYSAWSTVAVFDDILPRNVDMAARERHTQAWTGDVFRILEVLGTERPDLTLVVVDTEPTGLLMVLGLDPRNDRIRTHFDEAVIDRIAPDPQAVPAAVLDRTGAIAPDHALALPVWDRLRSDRGQVDDPAGRRALREALSTGA